MTTVQESKYNSIFYPALLISFVIALIGIIVTMYYIFYGIEDTGLSNEVPFGLWVASYVFFTGLSAGSLVVSSLSYVFGFEKYKPIARLSLWTAIILLAIAPIFLITDAGIKFINLYLHFNLTSIISWGSMLLIIYPLTCLIYGYWMIRPDLARKSQTGDNLLSRVLGFLSFKIDVNDPISISRDEQRAKTFGTLAVPIAIATHGYTGFLFALIFSRPLWNTPLMPLLFVISAMTSGISLLIVFIQGIKFFMDEDVGLDLVEGLSKILLFMLIFDLLLFVVEFFTSIYSASTFHGEALDLLFFGPNSFFFLFVQVFLGLAIPIVVLSFERFRKNNLIVVLISIFVIIGVFAMRMNIVIIGLLPDLWSTYGVYEGINVFHSYTPTLMEILVLIGSLGLLVFLLFVGYMILPLVPSERAEQFQYKYWNQLVKTDKIIKEDEK